MNKISKILVGAFAVSVMGLCSFALFAAPADCSTLKVQNTQWAGTANTTFPAKSAQLSLDDSFASQFQLGTETSAFSCGISFTPDEEKCDVSGNVTTINVTATGGPNNQTSTMKLVYNTTTSNQINVSGQIACADGMYPINASNLNKQ